MVKLFHQILTGDRGRFMALIVIMAVITGAVSMTTLSLLYDRYIQNQRQQLVTLVRSQARLIESVASFDSQYSKQDNIEGWRGATLKQIQDAHDLWKGFGDTGEFLIASLEGNKIKFLLDRRFDSGAVNIDEMQLGSRYFEPMQYALRGESGTIISLDYRGVKVLAAYEPVSVLDVGMVAKIDMEEVRGPFVRTGFTATSIALVLILLGTIIFRRIANPMIQKLEVQVQEQEHLVSQRTRELELSEKNFRNMVETIPGTVYQCLCDEHWTVKYISDYIEPLCGYPASDFLDNSIRTFASIIHSDDVDQVSEVINSAVKNHEPYTLEYRVLHANGLIRWVYEKGMGIYDADGKPELLDGTLLDITDRKHAEEEIARSEKQFRTLLEATPDAIIIVDADGKIIMANDQVQRLFQFTPQELTGKPIETLVPQKFRATHIALRSNYIRQPQATHREVLALRKDGSQFAAEINLNPIDTPQGLLVISSVRDISARKEAEKELRVSEQRLGLAMSAGHFTPWEYLVRETQIRIFTFFERILGYSPGEMEDSLETWKSVIHPNDWQLVNDAFRFYIEREKGEIRLQYRALTRDNRERWIETIGTITDWDEAGRPVKITGMQHDITEAKQSELVINEKIQQLEEFNRLAVGRELRMIELKQQINDLLRQSGAEEKYEIVK